MIGPLDVALVSESDDRYASVNLDSTKGFASVESPILVREFH
jgi:hypothetical protein